MKTKFFTFIALILFTLTPCPETYGFNSLGVTINEDCSVGVPLAASPAAKAQLKEGDILTAINGAPITTIDELWDCFSALRSGQKIKVTIQRNNKQITKDVVLSDHTDYHRMVIRSLLKKGESVHVIVIAAHFLNTFPLDPQVKQSWEQDSIKFLADQTERELLDFQGWDNFALIDRSIISDIIGEIQFSDTGFISQDKRANIGNLTGANYILHVSAARYPYGPQQLNLDKWSYKLISIETGEILSSTYTQWVTDSVGKTIKNYYQLQP